MWLEELSKPRVREVRVFNARLDARWLEDRGVSLATEPEGEPADAVVGGAEWLQRDRRSRLWGAWLKGTDSWYEERIPDPLRYQGLTPGAEHRFAFLCYREYIRCGVVEHIRFIEVEGGTQ